MLKERDLRALVPLVKRARGYRLYSFSGRRFLDLALSGGVNLLGHKSHLFVNELKQVCEKGLLSDFPSIYGKRLFKELSWMFPGYKTFLYALNLGDLFTQAGSICNRGFSAAEVQDPLKGPVLDSGQPVIWRPFFSGNTLSDFLLPVIPTGLGLGIHVMCVKTTPSSKAVPPPPPALPPLLLAAAAHSLKLLRALSLPDWYRPDLFAAAPDFIQKDIYLIPRSPLGDYRVLFQKGLTHGLVLSPHYPSPSILPFEVSSGELKKIVDFFNTGLGGEE